MINIKIVGLQFVSWLIFYTCHFIILNIYIVILSGGEGSIPCHSEWSVAKSKNPTERVTRLGASLAFPPSLGGKVSERTDEGCVFYFVISSGTQCSREIFAAGNGRNVVKRILPRTSSLHSRMTWE
jgi:hypothetical protein